MADDVMQRSAEAVQTPPVGSTLPTNRESRADRARRLVYRNRFAGIYLFLAVVAGIGIGGLVVMIQRDSPGPAPEWSAFEPAGSNDRRAAQIAERIPSQYRLPSGNQLAGVTYSGPPVLAGPDGASLQVRAIAVEADPTAARAEGDDFDTLPASGSLMYVLCGLGTACSIPEGETSVERGALLRREALELALYSFKYVEGTDSVLVLLPPGPDGQGATSVFLERSDVRSALDPPLRRTLSSTTPGIGEMSEVERQTVERLTQSHLYGYRPLQAQDGSFIMVLTPVLS